MSTNIRLFRFITGEIVIAKAQEKDGKFVLTNPVQIHVVPPQKPGDQPGLALGPWSQFVAPSVLKAGLTINKDHVTYEAEPIPQLLSAYSEQTTGLARPTNSGSLLVPPGV